MIESCSVARLLVEPRVNAERIQPCFDPGDLIGGHAVVRPVQVLIDSEVYQVTTASGHLAALKIGRPNAVARIRKVLAEEADLLHRIGGAPAPDLFELSELEDGRTYILVEWFEGDDAHTAVHKITESAGADAPRRVAELCANIIDAYAALHERGVVHADVHPRNVLVSEGGEVRIIDFGIGRAVDSQATRSRRAGVAFFFEPEHAQAVRSGARHSEPSRAGEQYGVAALIYLLLCDKYYLDFSFDKEELLRQIAEEAPLTFDRRGAAGFQTLEPVVLRALHKQPEGRFATTRQFAQAFRHAAANMKTKQLVEETVAPAGPKDAEARMLLERILAIVADPRNALDYAGPASPRTSLTYGSAGVAYAAYRIACAREDGRLLALADAWAERAALEEGARAFYSSDIQITPETVGRVSPYHSPSGVAVVQALIANARSDRFRRDTAVNRYLQLTSEECANPDLTWGRAGVLHGLTLVLEASGPEKPQQLVERGNQLCDGLLDLIQAEPGPGQDGTVSYLGIAHGWAGLLFAILRWRQFLKLPAPAVVEVRLHQLAECAHSTCRGARWPVQAGAASISLAGWCNGSAGYVHLWTLAHRVYRDALCLDLAEKAATDAYEGAGGGHALCCGFAGQAYAQLSLYKHTGNRRWLEQARKETRKACALSNALLSRHYDYLPHSLYKGDVGVAILATEIENPERASMPFFETEP